MGNTSILKMVVMIIGAAVLLSIAGIIYLVVQERAVPDILAALALSGFTGLLGLLAPSKDVTEPQR